MTTLRRPAIVGVGASLLIGLLWWQLLWTPQSASLASARRQEQGASATLLQTEQSVSHLKHLQVISGQLNALEQRLSDAAPAQDQLDQFFLSLNAVAQSSKVSVTTIGTSLPASSPAGLSTMSIHLAVEGDYFRVQDFLDQLRTLPRVVVVDSLAETPAAQKGGSNGVLASLGLHLLTGLEQSSGVQAGATPQTTPTTAAPTGIISGPVTKAKNAVSGANANTATVASQANNIGGH